MGKLKTAINNVTVFLDNAWAIMVRAAEIVAGIKLFGVQYMEKPQSELYRLHKSSEQFSLLM